MVDVFARVRRVLRDDGTLWLNLGDSYASGNRANYGPLNPNDKQGSNPAIKSATRPRDPPGIKPKDLLGIPWRVAFALQADGWYLRQDIIWHKPNPMPESVTDRCTKAHEYIFLFSKSADYFYDAEAVAEKALQPVGEPSRVAQHKQESLGQNQTGTLGTNQGSETRNRRSVWTVPLAPYKGAHFATFPPDLIEPCIRAGSPPEGNVLDPFNGAGTTGLVARDWCRNYTGIELNPEYVNLTAARLAQSHLF